VTGDDNQDVSSYWVTSKKRVLDI